VTRASFIVIAAAIAIGIFAGMLILLAIGERLGRRQLDRHGPDARAGVGVVDAAVFGLLGLLIGFTFSGAAARFDRRREIVGQEVNAARTAWLRIDLLPAESQPPMRTDLRQYVGTLIESYATPDGVADPFAEPQVVQRARNDLWKHGVAVTLAPGGEAGRVLILPALNDLFAVAENERLARRMHPPRVIFVMLAIAAFASALLAGYGLANKSAHNRTYTIGIAATVAVAIYVIIELEYPRLGLIRVNEMDRALVDFHATMQ